MDDVWGDDGDEHNAGKAERYDVERDSHKLKEEHIAVGYREAVDEAKETTLQEGFNVGYADAILLGFQLGKLQGLLRLIATFRPHGDTPMTDEFSKEIRSLTAELSAISSFDMLCGVSHENERSAEDIEAIQKNIGDVRKGIEMELENQKALATRRLDDLKERTSRILETLKASSQN